MTIETIQAICAKLPAVTEDIKWENHLCFNVGGKMFLVTAPDKLPVSASFKADDESFAELTERDGFIPAPYMARYKWVYLDDISRLSGKEWKHYAGQAYNLVAAKLPNRTIQNQRGQMHKFIETLCYSRISSPFLTKI